MPARRCRPVLSLRARRQRASIWVALAAIALVGLALAYGSERLFLMPAATTAAHSAVEGCAECHTNVSEGRFAWLPSVIEAADPRQDSEACLSCHSMSDAPFQPHGLAQDRLRQRTADKQATAASAMPVAAQLRRSAFPAPDAVFCATCHKEHQGKAADLTAVADARCHSCHKVQFNHFDTDHPPFDSYPFTRRTRIVYDHIKHAGDHFGEVRSRHPERSVPDTCADCHTTGPDGRHMGVKPFSEVCTTCHLDQITGAERAIGPKGIALITLPGLDLETLAERNADIGAWPEFADAELTPFMKLLIGWDDERRQMLDRIDELDLLYLAEASEEDIAAVERLVWEVKELIYALVTTRTSEVFERLASSTGRPVDGPLIARLTASIPRDVLIAAQRDWLPTLPSEIEQRADLSAGGPETGIWVPEVVPNSASVPPRAIEGDRAEVAGARLAQARTRVDAFGRVIGGSDDESDGGSGVEQGNPPAEADAQGQEEEQVEEEADADAAPLDGSADADDNSEPTAAQSPPEEVPLAIDAESWAEFGGWYRQDFAILYRPTGHQDRLLRAWLDFTASLYDGSESNPAVPVFKRLSGKDAQGRCTKCHSIDAGADGARVVNWQPSSPASTASRFTSFAHAPHFGLGGLKNDGCLTCHALEETADYLESYEGRDPGRFVPEFKPVERKQCGSCHTRGEVRQDCLLCHQYHVKGVSSPIMSTKVPGQ